LKYISRLHGGKCQTEYLLIEKDKQLWRSCCCSAIFLWTNNTNWDVIKRSLRLKRFVLFEGKKHVPLRVMKVLTFFFLFNWLGNQNKPTNWSTYGITILQLWDCFSVLNKRFCVRKKMWMGSEVNEVSIY
jgi:hypothetical protein